VESILQFLKDT